MGQVGAVGIGSLSVLGVLADWGGAGVKDFSSSFLGILNSIVTSWSCSWAYVRSVSFAVF